MKIKTTKRIDVTEEIDIDMQEEKVYESLGTPMFRIGDKVIILSGGHLFANDSLTEFDAKYLNESQKPWEAVEKLNALKATIDKCIAVAELAWKKMQEAEQLRKIESM